MLFFYLLQPGFYQCAPVAACRDQACIVKVVTWVMHHAGTLPDIAITESQETDFGLGFQHEREIFTTHQGLDAKLGPLFTKRFTRYLSGEARHLLVIH